MTAGIVADFGAAARRALGAGFDVLDPTRPTATCSISSSGDGVPLAVSWP